MEKNEEGKKKNLIIGGLCFIITVLAALLIYFIFIYKSDNSIENNRETANSASELKPWMEYILKQDITKIEVSNVSCSDDSDKTVTIDKNILKKIFNKFLNYEMVLSYANGGGWSCGETLSIEYSKNGKKYKLEYFGQNYLSPSSDGCKNISDKDLEKALNNSVDKKEDEELKDQEDICPFYIISTEEYILDEFIK